MKNVIGFLLKQNRLKQNMSQETLCKGICAVSYLSKIENGQVKPSDEIIQQLFLALKIQFKKEEELISSAKRWFKNYFEKSFCQEDKKEEIEHIKKVERSLEESELHLLYHIFLLYEAKSQEEQFQQEEQYLVQFLDHMEDELQFLYYMAKSDMETERIKALEHLKNAENKLECSFIKLERAKVFYWIGRYLEALEEAERAYQMAAEEGNLIVLIGSSLISGVSYSNCGNMVFMMKYLKKTLNLLRGTQNDLKNEIYYNIGATYVENKKYEESIPYLLDALDAKDLNTKLMSCHKLVIAYGELKKIQKAQDYYKKAAAWISEKTNPYYEKILYVAQLRLQENYLEIKEYEIYLRDIYQNITKEWDVGFGFKRFHGFFLIELYEHQRKYKEALLITKEINTYIS